jgi:hypothetical protein
LGELIRNLYQQWGVICIELFRSNTPKSLCCKEFSQLVPLSGDKVLIILLLNILCITKSLEVLAQTIETPTDSMPLYSVYRQELIRKGWLPVPQKFGVRPNIPEVVCGASGRLCTAYWLYSKVAENRELRFILWDTKRGLVVAPYME